MKTDIKQKPFGAVTYFTPETKQDDSFLRGFAGERAQADKMVAVPGRWSFDGTYIRKG